MQSLHDKAKFKDCLGKQKNYPNFLKFFQREIGQKGVEKVLSEYVFSGDENAESMLARLFGGILLLFPMIRKEARRLMDVNANRTSAPNYSPRFRN